MRGRWWTVAAAVFVFGATARADVAGSSPFLVNETVSGYAERPVACRRPDGGFVVAWEHDTQDAGTPGIFLRRFTSTGTPAGTEVQVNTYTTGTQARPDVCCDAGGGWTVVWESIADGASDSVAMRRYASDGTPVGTEALVNVFTTSNQAEANVACEPDGDFLVVWNSNGQDGSGQGVVARRYASTGTPTGSELVVNTYTTNGQDRPDVARLADGSFVVVWESNNQDGDGDAAMARRLDATGALLGTEFQMNAVTSSFQNDVAVCAPDAGGFVATWRSPRDGDTSAVIARRFGADVTPATDELIVNTYTTGGQEEARPACAANGDFVVAWADFGYQDGNASGVFAQRMASTGVRVGTEFQVNTYTSGYQGTPGIAAAPSGDFLILWHGPGTGDPSGIFARIFVEQCGNGTVDAGEQCDDGDQADGDCCSATCQFEAAGSPCPDDQECTADLCDGAGTCTHLPVSTDTPCTSDGVDCTDDHCGADGVCAHDPMDAGCSACNRCDPTAGCVVRPRDGCLVPTRARQASLSMTNRSPDAKDRVSYSWRGEETVSDDFGALPASPDYAFCVFDKAGGTDRLVVGATIPSGSGWKKRGGKGFRYRSGSGLPAGVTKVELQSGGHGKSKITLSGKGGALGLETLGLTPPVTVELQQRSEPNACFRATFPAAQKNTPTTFRAKSQ